MFVVSVVMYRSLRRADHSSRGVLPTAVSRCAWSGNLVNEEALAHWGLLLQNKQTYIYIYVCVCVCVCACVRSYQKDKRTKPWNLATGHNLPEIG